MATTASGARILDDHNVTTFPNRDTTSNCENNNNYNNYNIARAHARERQAVLDAYLDVFGRSMPGFVAREVDWMEQQKGITLGMILSVIEYTACAPRPSWAYARTVLLRNQEKGVVTAIDFENSLAARGCAGYSDLPY